MTSLCPCIPGMLLLLSCSSMHCEKLFEVRQARCSENLSGVVTWKVKMKGSEDV